MVGAIAPGGPYAWHGRMDARTHGGMHGVGWDASGEVQREHAVRARATPRARDPIGGERSEGRPQAGETSWGHARNGLSRKVGMGGGVEG